MKKLANLLCWLLILPLLVVTLLVSITIVRLFLGPPVFSGNAFIDPVIFILNYLSPIAALGVIGLVFLQRRGWAKVKPAALAITLFLSFTIALVIYGYWFFHDMPDFQLWHEVWWLEPIWILWLAAYIMTLVTLIAGFSKKYRRLLPLSICTFILFVFGAGLAWLFVSTDFSLNSANLFAVIPFTIACVGLIRLVFVCRDDRTRQS